MDAYTGTKPVAEQHAFDTAALQAYLQAHLDGFSGPLMAFASLPSSHLYSGAGMTRRVVPSIRPVPVIVDEVPEQTVATSSRTVMSKAPATDTLTVIVCVPPSASVALTQVPAKGLRGSTAGLLIAR